MVMVVYRMRTNRGQEGDVVVLLIDWERVERRGVSSVAVTKP